MRLWWVSFCISSSLAACFDVAVSSNAVISCEVDAQCPAPTRCVLARCRDVGDDLAAPAVVGVVDVPGVVGLNREIEARLTTNEAAAATMTATTQELQLEFIAREDGDGDDLTQLFVAVLGTPVDAQWNVDLELVDAAGNRANLEDVAAFRSDVSPPRLVSSAVDANGAVGRGDEAVVTLVTDEDATVTLAGEGVTVTIVDTSEPRLHRFDVLFADDADDGPHVLTATLSDANGNVASVEATSINVDATPPALLRATARIEPADDAVFASVSEAGEGSAVVVDLDLSEPVIALTLRLYPLDRELRQDGEDGDRRSTWRADIALLPGEADGPQSLVIEATDVVGNASVVVVDDIVVVDTTPPPAPNLDMENIVYLRAPFGDGVDGRTRRFALSSEGPVLTRSGAPVSETTFAVVDDPDAAFSSVVGIVEVGADGAIAETALSGVDRLNLWLRAADAAGNLSDEAAAVVIVDFRVTPRGVSAQASEHLLRADLRTGATGLVLSNDSQMNIDDAGRAGARDGVVVDLDAPRLPRIVDLDMPQLMGGDSCATRGDEVFCVEKDAIVSFDGASFRRQPTNDNSGDGSPFIDFHDLVRVVVDGDEIAVGVTRVGPNSCDGCNSDCGLCEVLGPSTPMALWRLGNDDDWHPDASFTAPDPSAFVSLLALAPRAVAVVQERSPNALVVGDGVQWQAQPAPPAAGNEGVRYLVDDVGPLAYVTTVDGFDRLCRLVDGAWVQLGQTPAPVRLAYDPVALTGPDGLTLELFDFGQFARWSLSTNQLTLIPFDQANGLVEPSAVARVGDEVVLGTTAARLVDDALQLYAFVVPAEAAAERFDFPIADINRSTRLGQFILSPVFIVDSFVSVEDLGVFAASADGVHKVLLGERFAPEQVHTQPGRFANTFRSRAVVGPAPRQRAALAFDDVRGVVVMFGGIGTDSNLLDDVWETTVADVEAGKVAGQIAPPLTWTQVVPVDPEGDGNPGGRFDGVLRADPDGGVVLHGGLSTTVSHEVWRFDGASFARESDDDEAALFALRTNTDGPRDPLLFPAHHFQGWLETRPTLVFTPDIASAGYAELDGVLVSLRADVLAAGTGDDTDGGVDGARLVMGNASVEVVNGEPVAVTGATPAPVVLTTRGDNRLGRARLSVDAVTVTARFHL